MKRTLLILIIVSATALVGAVLLASTGEKPSGSTGGKLVADPTAYDWGTIGLQPASATFNIRNDGTAALKITKVSTSCGCTSAVLNVGGKTSPRFGMEGHGYLPPANVTLQPGEGGQVIVTFDPLFHANTQGAIERLVYLRTDSPDQPEVELTVRGTVVR